MYIQMFFAFSLSAIVASGCSSSELASDLKSPCAAAPISKQIMYSDVEENYGDDPCVKRAPLHNNYYMSLSDASRNEHK